MEMSVDIAASQQAVQPPVMIEPQTETKINKNKLVEQIMQAWPNTKEIKVCFNSYRKTPYGYAIRPILIQLVLTSGERGNLTYQEIPVDEIYVKLNQMDKGYLHCITFTGKYYHLEHYKDKQYQQVAQNMKNKWRPVPEVSVEELSLVSFI